MEGMDWNESQGGIATRSVSLSLPPSPKFCPVFLQETLSHSFAFQALRGV